MVSLIRKNPGLGFSRLILHVLKIIKDVWAAAQ